ncbi:MAG TPA: HAD hydrolase-like protein, partial [Tissierellaceae bacterium]
MNYLDNIDGIIFDLDGTLIDSMGVWKNLASEFLRKNKIVPNDDLEEVIKTMTLLESSRYLIKEYNLNYTVDEVIS